MEVREEIENIVVARDANGTPESYREHRKSRDRARDTARYSGPDGRATPWAA